MLALKINTTKAFMHKLLIGDTFHIFSLAEASITTFNQFHIDGKLHMDFFDTDTAQQLSENGDIYSSWKDVKSYCYSIIRGKLPPLQFKFVMRLSPQQMMLLPLSEDPSVPADEILPAFSDVITVPAIRGLNLNLQYKNHELFCTTGTFSRLFTLDKTFETTWDNAVMNFFRGHQIDFTIL